MLEGKLNIKRIWNSLDEVQMNDVKVRVNKEI